MQYFTDMDEQTYHSDPFENVTLSSSMIVTLLKKTPRHLFCETPRLNPDAVRDESKAADLGNAIHDELLGGGSISWLDVDDFRTKEAREKRDLAYANGQTPMKLCEKPLVDSICASVRDYIQHHPEHNDAFSGGDMESSLFWEKDGVHKRCRFDHVNWETGWIDDLKTTALSIPDWIDSQLYREHKFIQDVHYSEGFEAKAGKPPKGFRYLVVEVKPPFLCAFVQVEPSHRSLCDQAYECGVNMWREAFDSGDWRGYPNSTLYGQMPPWVASKIESLSYIQGAI